MTEPHKPALPPLRSLEEPLYVIPERKDPPRRKKPTAAARTVHKKQAKQPMKRRR
jgi:hypothetical protein